MVTEGHTLVRNFKIRCTHVLVNVSQYVMKSYGLVFSYCSRVLISIVLLFQSDDNASFLRAARGGNLEKVLEYLKASTDINTCNAVSFVN